MMMPPAGGVPPGSRDGMRMSPSNAASGRAMRSLALVLAIGLAVAGLLARDYTLAVEGDGYRIYAKRARS